MRYPGSGRADRSSGSRPDRRAGVSADLRSSARAGRRRRDGRRPRRPLRGQAVDRHHVCCCRADLEWCESPFSPPWLRVPPRLVPRADRGRSGRARRRGGVSAGRRGPSGDRDPAADRRTRDLSRDGTSAGHRGRLVAPVLGDRPQHAADPEPRDPGGRRGAHGQPSGPSPGGPATSGRARSVGRSSSPKQRHPKARTLTAERGDSAGIPWGQEVMPGSSAVPLRSWWGAERSRRIGSWERETRNPTGTRSNWSGIRHAATVQGGLCATKHSLARGPL
jgi:hypothetical protein